MAAFPSPSADPTSTGVEPSVWPPAGACDGHVHVFDPARFPYALQRSYTPAAAPLAALQAFHRRLGINRAVIVQPSVYGTDNGALLDALAALGQAGRGVAVIHSGTATAASLQALHAGGVRGVRLNLEGHSAGALETAAEIRRLEKLLAPLGWCLQVYLTSTQLALVADTLAKLSVPVVLDHFGGLKANDADVGQHTACLLSLLDHGHIHVKLSAPFRAGASAPGYAGIAPIATQLVRAAPERLVWASDWPHTSSSVQRDGDLSRIEHFREEDAARTLALLPGWAADAEACRRILVDNPAQLYGFDA